VDILHVFGNLIAHLTYQL